MNSLSPGRSTRNPGRSSRQWGPKDRLNGHTANGRSQSGPEKRALTPVFQPSWVLWATVVFILWACYAEGAFLSPAKTGVAIIAPLLGLAWLVSVRRQAGFGAKATYPVWGLTEYLLLALGALGAVSWLWSLDWSDSLRAAGILVGGLLILRMGREVGWSLPQTRSSVLLIVSEVGVLLSVLSITGCALKLSRFTQNLGGETLPTGTFGYANALAGFLFLSLAATVAVFMETPRARPSGATTGPRAPWGRWFLLTVAVILQAAALVLCQSRAAGAIAIGLVLVVLCVKAVAVARDSPRRRSVTLLLLGSVLVCMIGGALLWQGTRAHVSSTDTYRIATWMAAIEASMERPFLGHGLDTFLSAYAPFKSGGHTSYAHNIVVQYLVELGSFGAVLVVGFLAAALVPPIRNLVRLSAGPQIPLLLGLQAFALHNLVDLTWFFPALFLIFMLMLGLMLSYLPARPMSADVGNDAHRQKRLLRLGLAGLLVVVLAFGGGFALWSRGHSTSAWAPAFAQMPATIVSGGAGVTDVDVVIYGTQTSGITAAREISQQMPHLRVAVISSGEYLESPLAQGLSVEDARDVSRIVGGAYKEWRDNVIYHYWGQGADPFTTSGRFVYGPSVAAQFRWAFLEGPGVVFYSGRLVVADDTGDDRWVVLKLNDGSLARVNTRYFIDASVEADLSRMLGASYRIGRSEAVYNDVSGPTPPAPARSNDFITAPQRLSALLTLKLHSTGRAPRIAGLASPWYDPCSYGSAARLTPSALSAFADSWSMMTATLPDQEHELNENWTDYPDGATAFDWVFDPTRRTEIFGQVVERSLNAVRYLQEQGYPRLSVANIPQYPYVREGPRVVGLTTYTVSRLLGGAEHEVVAVGCHTQYDRHDARYPTLIDTTAYACVPMQALMVQYHPWMLVSTAVSTDYQTYSSPVRMELTRANMGGAAGAMVVLAAEHGVELSRVSYEQLRKALQGRGYRLDLAQQ